MDIKIDQDAIAFAINTSATKALTQALSGWNMQQAIGEIVSTEVISGAVADAVKLAVAQIDRSALANALAGELQRATTRAVITLLNEGLVDIICKLRGIGAYGEDVKRRAEVKAEVTSRGGEGKS